MGTVTVAPDTYEIYGDLAGAQKYLRVIVTPAGVAWNALDTTTQSKLLVNARYLLDRQDWQGDPTFIILPSTPTELQWPRSNAYDKNGILVTGVPASMPAAEYEIAAQLATNPSFYEDPGGAPVRILRSGPEEVEFFSPPGNSGDKAIPLPSAAMKLVGQYLRAPAIGATTYQADGETNKSNFGDSTYGGHVDNEYKRNGPF
jgi:hypothetical protein